MHTLPISLRSYSVLEDLWWGEFGFYIRSYPGQESNKLLIYLQDRVIDCLSKDVEAAPSKRLPRSFWKSEGLCGWGKGSAVVQGADLLSDWATCKSAPFVYSFGNLSEPREDVISVPFLFNANRLGKAFVDEVFLIRNAA